MLGNSWEKRGRGESCKQIKIKNQIENSLFQSSRCGRPVIKRLPPGRRKAFLLPCVCIAHQQPWQMFPPPNRVKANRDGKSWYEKRSNLMYSYMTRSDNLPLSPYLNIARLLSENEMPISVSLPKCFVYSLNMAFLRVHSTFVRCLHVSACRSQRTRH